MQRPIGKDPLHSIITQNHVRTTCLVISDHTRPVPNKIILPPLLEEKGLRSFLEKEQEQIGIFRGRFHTIDLLEFGKMRIDQIPYWLL